MFAALAVWTVTLVLALALSVLLVLALWRVQSVRRRDTMWATLMSKTPWTDAPFDPSSLSTLPEPARRFLAFAIPAGSPLRTVAVVVTRTGSGLAHSIVAAPHGWLRRGYDAAFSEVTGFCGAERLDGRWWRKIMPVNRQPISHAAMVERAVLETVLWTPTILCRPDATWTRLGDDRVRLTLRFGNEACDLELSVSGSGALEAIASVDGRLIAVPSEFKDISGLRLPTRAQFGNEILHLDRIRFVPPYRGHSHT